VASSAPGNAALGGDGTFALYRRLIGARVRADLTYRFSFALRVLSAMLVTALDYVAIWALVSKVQTIGGWDKWQVTYLYGASSVAFRAADAFIGGPVERCSHYVRVGTFDTFLVRPRSALLQVFGHDFAVRRVGQLAAMVPFLVVALANLNISWSVGKVLFLAAQLIGATLLFSAVFVIVSCLAFWSPESREIANAFTYGGATVAEYPVHAMASWIRSLTFTIVPVAFTAYFPAFVLFDATNPLGVPRWVSYASPLACVPVGLLAVVVWRFAVRRYRSTGS
jgi:ABC-2 type transport system permease protein